MVMVVKYSEVKDYLWKYNLFLLLAGIGFGMVFIYVKIPSPYQTLIGAVIFLIGVMGTIVMKYKYFDRYFTR